MRDMLSIGFLVHGLLLGTSFALRRHQGDDEVRVWLTVPSSALLEPLMSSSAAALGCRSSKKKTVHFALPGRVIRPLQWRDDVIWARVEPIKGRRHATVGGGHLFQPPSSETSSTTVITAECTATHVHRRSASNCSSVDSNYANVSSQEDNQSSSSGDSVPNIVILTCSGQRSIVRIGSESTSVDSSASQQGSRSDSDYQSKNDSSELSSMTEGSPPTSARGPEQRTSGDVGAALAFSQRLQCTECVQCALMEDAVQRLEASRREAGLKLRSYEAQIRSLQQACCSAEATLRDEKALHAVTRQELGRVLDRLRFYTGSRTAVSSSSSAALKDYRALRNSKNTSQNPCLSSVQWNRTFRKNRAGVKVCESKCQHVISIQQTRGAHNSDIGVQVNLLARSIDDRPKLSAKMRYGIAAVFQDKSSCKTLPSNAGRGTRISKPLRGVITEREAALGILSREVKLLQEERDHLQELLQHSLQGVVPQHAAHVARGLQEQIDSLKAENQRLLDSYNAERVLRKKYYNMVEDMKGKIRVCCRVKPLTTDQQNKDALSVIDATDDYTLVVHAPRGDKEFTFDRVFMPHHTQEDVFGETNSLVQSAMDGYNVCIFAYGQTGSGKTYTLTGVSNTEQLQAEGIAPRAFRRMFELVKENEMKQSFVVTATFVELYNERFVDLLKANSNPEEKLEVRKDSSGHTFVPGVTTEEVSNSAQLCECFARALRNRRVACTRMNAQSSRSHFVATVEITSTNRLNGAVLRGKLSLVDLAGSERLEKSGLEGQHIKETNSINKSLSALGDVIQALVTQQSHVPYRNNKLTMLMQDSLGGTAKTLMFVNVSPSSEHVEETVNSLVYATRVRQITNDVVRASETKEIAKLKSVIAKLKKEISP
ncbi:uncharacterized protein [Dermacentor albipictus]|uniref:uncharacterized protein isoform X3 n=1 Tax=Dermacentor albipictus TaxID=60249 RepID=UPI0038FCF04C